MPFAASFFATSSREALASIVMLTLAVHAVPAESSVAVKSYVSAEIVLSPVPRNWAASIRVLRIVPGVAAVNDCAVPVGVTMPPGG